MGYFNINNILYNLRKISKYLCYSLLIVAFVVIALLLMGKGVHAVAYETGFTDAQVEDILNTHDNIVNDTGIDFDYWICTLNPGSSAMISFFNSSSDNIVFYANNGYINCTQPVVGHSYLLRGNGTYSDAGSFNANSLANRIGYVDNNLCFYGNVTLYDYDKTSILWVPPSSSSFFTPYIALPNDSLNTYINGEFYHYLVVAYDNQSPLDEVDYCYLEYWDESESYTDENTKVLLLNKESPYYLSNYEGGTIFNIPKTLIPYLDGHTYHLRLGYSYNDVVYRDEPYTWTTAFSSRAILNDQLRAQDNFLNVDDNVRLHLPSNSFVFNDDLYLDNIFIALKNAFINEETTNINYPIPFSDEIVSVPSDYIEEHLPSYIVTIIQIFYWYLISRYIFKDIFKLVDGLRTGNWFTANDEDIKTEVL